MKYPRTILISLALNLVLVAVVMVLRARPSVSLPAEASGVTQTTLDRPVPDLHADTADQPVLGSRPGRFHWGQVESADYRQYIANLRALGCPERLVREIIIADVAKLYAGRLRVLGSARDNWQPWHGSERRRAAHREHSVRVSALHAEQRALIKELLGIDWNERFDDLANDDDMIALVLGFLPENKPAQLIAMIEDYFEAKQQVREQVHGILLEEDRQQLARLREEMMMKFSTLMTPAEFDEFSLRAQSVGKFMEGDIHLDGLALSGPEFRELCGLSRLTGDVIQDEILRDRDGKELTEEDKERQQRAFEAEVKKLLGPARFADFQRAQQSEFRDAFEFTEEHHLPTSTAARISEAMRSAEEQASQIKEDQSLSPDERVAALTLLKSITVNTLSSVLGSNYAEYARGHRETLDDLTKLPSIEPEGKR